MDKSEKARGLRFGTVGSFGTIFSASVATGCCAGVLAPLASVATAAFPFLDDYSSLQMPLLYGTVALTLVGVLVSYRRQHSAFNLILGLFGGFLLLIPFHMALDLRLFYTMIGVGLGSLLLASWGPLIRSLVLPLRLSSVR